MSCRGLLVTGTDTDVGKTYVSQLILKHLVTLGKRTGAYKPVCSGAILTEQGKTTWSDVEQLSAALKRADWKEKICPQTFLAPLAPPRSARLEGKQVNENLLGSGLEWWQNQVEWLLVEGAGGLLSPISQARSVADFARECGYPLLFVSRLGLGTLNHTRLSVEAAQRRGLRVAGVVLNQVTADFRDESIKYNFEDLKALVDVPVLGVLRHGQERLENHFGVGIEMKWEELFDFPCSIG